MRNSYDVFLVLNDFQACASQHRAALNPLSSTVESHLIGAEGYLNTDANTGLIVLRFSMTSKRVLGAAAIHAMAAESRLPMIIPQALAAPARRAFYMRHLRKYSVYLQQYPARGEAYGLLTRTLLGLAAHIADGVPADEFASTVDVPLEDVLDSPFETPFEVRSHRPFESTLDVDEQDILNELPVIIDLPLRRRRRADTVL